MINLQDAPLEDLAVDPVEPLRLSMSKMYEVHRRMLGLLKQLESQHAITGKPE